VSIVTEFMVGLLCLLLVIRWKFVVIAEIKPTSKERKTIRSFEK